MTDVTPNHPLRIFLCHASGDKPAVRELYHRLCADGFAPWLDEENLLPGEDWEYEIPKAVRESDVVLVCLSQHSINKAGYVQKEIKFALDVADQQPEGTIFLIPLKLEECVVPTRLSRWQWVNQFEANGYARLVRSLRVRAGRLGLSQSASASDSPVKDAPPSVPSNVSGSVKFDANTVSVGRDVAGRDLINQTTYNIAQATIIQGGAAAPEIKPTVSIITPSIQGEAPIPANKPTLETPSPIVNVLQPREAPILPGVAWLSDTNNRCVIGGMEFVRVPAGEFIMGSAADNNLANSDEHPQHTVDIPYDYWIGKYPVTNEQFAKFVTTAKYQFTLTKDWQKKANHPAVKVPWREAMAYCKWLDELTRSELKNLTLRLPTEAEWEKAARGTQGNEWPWGNDWDPNKCNFSESGKGSTTPAGSYSPQGDSPYGAADMAGNVWEWCHSLYKPYLYQAQDGREDATGDDRRVLRGGSWRDDRGYARCACRYRYPPVGRLDYLGFRCIVSSRLSLLKP